jgi:hypothetical protein
MSAPKKQYMGRDQYGNTWHALTHPRKELRERIGGGRVSKMYVDDAKTGAPIQTGYVIGSHWVTLYEVIPMRRPGL